MSKQAMKTQCYNYVRTCGTQLNFSPHHTHTSLIAHNQLNCAFSWLYLNQNWTLSTSTFLGCVFRLKECTFSALSTQLTQLQLFSQLFQVDEVDFNWTETELCRLELNLNIFCGWQSGLQLNQNWTLSTWTLSQLFLRLTKWTSTEPKLNFVDLNLIWTFFAIDKVDFNWTKTKFCRLELSF